MDLTDASDLARDLMAHHLSDEWTFRFDHAKTRFGSCDSRNKVITLSRTMTTLNEQAAVHDTILHEIAHAKAGWRAGHGPRWKEWAIRLGAKPNRELDKDVNSPTARWIGQCPSCRQIIHRHRRTAIACAACCKRYNGGLWCRQYLFCWREHDSETVSFQSEIAAADIANPRLWETQEEI